MSNLIEEWKKRRGETADQHKKLLTSLSKTNKKILNQLAEDLHDSVFEKVDCLSCANCCKSIPPLINETDIRRISKFLGMQLSQFTAENVTVDEDGDIVVINSCYEEDGNLDVAEGLAKVVDKKTNSKLEVSFVSFLGIRPFWGDYWIIGLDENYQWAVVGTPGRKYGWVLSRTPTLPDETMQEIYKILKSQNYDPATFEISTNK